MKKFVSLLLFLVLISGGYRYYSIRSQKTKGENPFAQFIAPVKKRDIQYSIDVSGDVIPEIQIDVKSEVGGKVKALHVQAGEHVKKGQLLCEIDDIDLRNEEASVEAQLDGARLSVERIQQNYDRAQELFKRNLVTKETFDNLASDLAIAKNGYARVERQLQTVRDRIAKTKITSPTAGTLLNVNVVEGQVVIGAASVNSGTTLMNVADLSRLLLEATINQVDVARLELNQHVKFRVDSTREIGMEGRVIFIAPVALTKNGVKGFQVKASITNPSPAIKPGMTVAMTIPVAEAKGAVSVPIVAIFKGEGDVRQVYVVADEKEAEKATAREVGVGVSNLNYTEITSGLQEGERVLLVEPRLLVKKPSS